MGPRAVVLTFHCCVCDVLCRRAVVELPQLHGPDASSAASVVLNNEAAGNFGGWSLLPCHMLRQLQCTLHSFCVQQAEGHSALSCSAHCLPSCMRDAGETAAAMPATTASTRPRPVGFIGSGRRPPQQSKSATRTMLLYNPDTFPQQEMAADADWVWQPVTMVGSAQVQGCCGWSRVNRSACVLLLLSTGLPACCCYIACIGYLVGGLLWLWHCSAPAACCDSCKDHAAC